MERQLETYQKIERSIIKKFRKQLWTPFIVAVKRYELIQAGDKIAVCISGGKDSMLMAKLLQELQRHSEVPFELVYLVMDPGYNEINRQKIESNAALLHIPITVFETNIFDVANNSDKSPCYLCARMRRGHLYKKAQELGCNKIALGHQKTHPPWGTAHTDKNVHSCPMACLGATFGRPRPFALQETIPENALLR